MESEIIGNSDAVRELVALLDSVASADAPVMIQGETGTGKELVARYLHAKSGRAQKPFIKLNCAALPSELAESELFGYERGAFTGALQRKRGVFETANGGTILLDEIGDMDVRLQAKLLQVLQDREFLRIGGSETVKVDVRVICATHRDIEKQIEKGEFHEDLYYRLNVINIQVPPLRDRREDIPLLVRHFVQQFGGEANKRVDPESIDALVRYDWPGNIRELQNTVRRAVILSEGPVVKVVARALHSDSGRNLPEANLFGYHEISIAFDRSLSPDQITATLTALANYYRACGGLGLSVEFEDQEAVTEAVHV